MNSAQLKRPTSDREHDLLEKQKIKGRKEIAREREGERHESISQATSRHKL